MKSVMLNNTAVEVNQAYIQSESMIVTIPDDLPLKGTDSSLPNQIRIITASGTATFDFTFLSPTPTITDLTYTMPATAGQPFIITGTNFYEVQKIVFTVNGNAIDVTDFTVDNTYSNISLAIPAGGDADGTVTVITESGQATKSYKATVNPYITSFSTDIPVPGDSMVIAGEYFISISKIILPGNVEVPASKLTINTSKTRIAFVMPSLKAIGTVKVVSNLTTVESSTILNDTTKILYNHDGVGAWDWSGTTDATDGVNKPLASRGKFKRFKGTIPAYTGWWQANGYAFSGWSSTISDATLVSDLTLKFNFYSVNAWAGAGYIQVKLFNNDNYSVILEPWKDGTVPTGRWIEMSIPLSSFNIPNMTTYADWKTQTTDNAVVFIFANRDGQEVSANFCLDDIRISQ
ncbi:MAG TPA: glycan-binding surface protein [Ohtaekwangia sp.]|uniref:glycan-binding surface protein n=1 Tax=Ohtaekwangia sp. TaxID=2066019 RepID=UPI002F936629